MEALRDALWTRLDRLCLADLPSHGDVGACYALREAASEEVVYIGSTKSLRRRLFANHLGGVGGATTQRIHRELFEPGVLAGVEVTWIANGAWQALEADLKRQFLLLTGGLPRWVRR